MPNIKETIRRLLVESVVVFDEAAIVFIYRYLLTSMVLGLILLLAAIYRLLIG